jgi:hypothetical protein
MAIKFNPQTFAANLQEMHRACGSRQVTEDFTFLNGEKITISMKSVPRSSNPLKSLFGLLKKTQITVTSNNVTFGSPVAYNGGKGMAEIQERCAALANLKSQRATSAAFHRQT